MIVKKYRTMGYVTTFKDDDSKALEIPQNLDNTEPQPYNLAQKA